MSSYVIPVFPAASRVPPRDALAARLAELTGRFAELSSELAALASAVGSVSGKADEAPPSAAGNLASLDASGNLADSGATPASIKAAAVAEVVANAPGTMDTLKEIADILGSSQESGTVMKRISDLERGKANVLSLAVVAMSGSYNDLSDKPDIPAAAAIDPALAMQGAAADAKAVGDALRGGFTEWELDKALHLVWTGTGWEPRDNQNNVPWGSPKGDLDSVSLSWTLGVDAADDITATRHLVTPTKTSQLTNDSGFLTSHQDISGKADKVSGATAGNLASLDAHGNLADSGAKASDFAAKSDLRYALVEPGAWEFSDGQSHVVTGPAEVSGYWHYTVDGTTLSEAFVDETEALNMRAVDFDVGGLLTATRTSLPGRLLDRVGNRVVVSGDTTLTLPAAVPGYLRDFLVRLEISGSTVPTITFAAPTGETIIYETDGDEFPVPDEAGNWVYSFTENCVAHTFAVSLKKVNTVAQGGS